MKLTKGEHFDVRFLRVIDGDTFVGMYEVDDDLWRERSFRLARIQAPELHGVSADEKAKGNAARLALTALVGSTVLIGCEYVETDKYKRLVVEAHVGPVNLSDAQLAAGHAVPYREKK